MKTVLAWSLLMAALLAFAYHMAWWDFSSPFAVYNAAYSGKLHPGQTHEEVREILGSHWRVKNGFPVYPTVEEWCRWGECVYFDTAKKPGPQVFHWINFWARRGHFPPRSTSYVDG